MSSSSRDCTGSRRRPAAFSLIEVLVCLVILALSLVPIFDLFLSSNRIGHSARRAVDATVYGQTVLEGLAMLDPADMPDIQPGGEEILLEGDQVRVKGRGRFLEVADYFDRSRPFEFEERTVSGKRLQSGELLVKIELKWLGIVSDPRSLQSVTLQVLTPPRRWL